MTFNFFKRAQEEIDVSTLSARHAKPKGFLYFDPEKELQGVDFLDLRGALIYHWMTESLRADVELFPLVLKLFFEDKLKEFLSSDGANLEKSWDAKYNQPAGRYLRLLKRYVFRAAALKECLFTGHALLSQHEISKVLNEGLGSDEGYFAYRFYHKISGQGEDIDLSSEYGQFNALMRGLYQSGNFVRFADYYMLAKMVYPQGLSELNFDPQVIRDLYERNKAYNKMRGFAEGRAVIEMMLLGGALYMMSVDQVLVSKGKITVVKNAAEPIAHLSLPLANRLKDAANY